MTRKFNINLEDKVFQQLTRLCNNDENAIRDYIVQVLKESLDGNEDSSADKDSLESYLNKGQPGSRNYGVKGQGW